MSEEVVIRVENVSKDFLLPHEKISSVKSLFTGLFKGLNRTKEVQHALKDVSLEIKKGEFFGIVGRNGSGKSTLLKMLAGIYQPSGGSIQAHGRLVPFIELGVGFNPELSGRENVYLNGAMLGFSDKEVDAMYDEIVAFAELERFMDQKLKNYSSGMQVRLAFSMATRAQADILLVDEVLAVGDADFQRKCYEYFKKLKKDKKTVVFVSHDMSAVREFCDRAALIDQNELKFLGSSEAAAREYSLLFMDKQSSGGAESESKRWGNQKAIFTDVTSEVADGNINVGAAAKIKSDIDKVLYGIHINASDGSEITALNNRMINQPDLNNLQAGQTVNFSWEILNIFNDGKFWITLTLVDDEGTVLDWYNDAMSFTVKRQERSTTSVIPPIKVTAKVSGKKGIDDKA